MNETKYIINNECGKIQISLRSRYRLTSGIEMLPNISSLFLSQDNGGDCPIGAIVHGSRFIYRLTYFYNE